MRHALVAALVALSPLSVAADDTDELLQLVRQQSAQIEALQRQLNEQGAAVRALQARLEETSAASEQANQKAEMLADSLETMPAWAAPSTTFGGYGELHAGLLENQRNGEDDNELDFHRFVLFMDHSFNDRLRFVSELEVEHALAGDGAPGEVELEQAYVEYDWRPGHRLRSGLFLLPVGFLNETHEPPTFYGVERNPIETRILPTTWWEGGVAFTGQLGDAVTYDFAGHSGLYTTAGSAYAIRSGRQKVAEARFDSFAYTGRLAWRGVPGLELAASVQYQEDITQETDPLAGAAWLYNAQLAWQTGAFGLRALYARWELDGAGPEAIGADRQEGWYLEPSWRFNDNWGVFARYSAWDNLAGSAIDTEYTQTDVGVNYWLNTGVVFKLDYQDQDAPAAANEFDGWHLGVGYQF